MRGKGCRAGISLFLGPPAVHTSEDKSGIRRSSLNSSKLKEASDCLWFHVACAARELLLTLPGVRFSGRSHQTGTRKGSCAPPPAADPQHKGETPAPKLCTQPPLRSMYRWLARHGCEGCSGSTPPWCHGPGLREPDRKIW